MAQFAGITATVDATDTQLQQIVETGGEPWQFTINLDGQEFDTTAFAALGISTYLKGLSGWSWSLTQRFKTASTGDLGLVTFAAGYTTNLNAWDLAVEVAALETTAFGATTRSYIPGKLSWGGSFSGYMDDTTPMTHVGNSSEPATGTFKLREAGTPDDTLSGSIFTTQGTGNVDPNSVASLSYTYRGSGDLTQSAPQAGTTIFPVSGGASTVVARPTVNTLRLTAISGQYFEGSVFWTRVAVSVAVNQVATVEVAGMGTGALTFG